MLSTIVDTICDVFNAWLDFWGYIFAILHLLFTIVVIGFCSFIGLLVLFYGSLYLGKFLYHFVLQLIYT